MVAFSGKKVAHSGVVIEFTTLIHVDIFIRTGISRGVLREEISKPFNWGSFGSPGITILHASEVVSDKNPACLTIESFIVLPSGCSIIRRLARKGKIDGQSLMGFSGSPGGLMSRGSFRLLRLYAGGAHGGNIGFPGEFGNSSHRLVGIIKVLVVGVTKSLMPEQLLRSSFDGRDWNKLERIQLFKGFHNSSGRFWVEINGVLRRSPLNSTQRRPLLL